MQSTASSHPHVLRFYVTTVSVGAVVALALAVLGQEWQTSRDFTNGVVAILAIGLAAELSSVSLHVGSSILSIAFIPFLAAAFLFPPIWAMSVAGLDFGEAWVRVYGGSVLYDFFAIPVPALLAYLYTRWQLGGVVALSVPLFVVRHIYSMNLQLLQANRDLLELMVKAIEARDPY